MTLDSVLKAVRRMFQKTGPPNHSAGAADGRELPDLPDDDESVDPFNPFPETVIIEFRDVIDLHSIPPKQVLEVVEGYLEEAYERGCPCVRIIHGKGIGVQREMVRSILARTPFVIDFKDAPMEAGGWGATIVTLNVRENQQGESAPEDLRD